MRVNHGGTWSFPVLYLGWAWFFWLFIVLSGEQVWSMPNVLLLLLGGLSPILAGLGLMWRQRGREGLRDVWQRLTEFRRISLAWWLIILLFYPLYNLLLALFARVAGISVEPLQLISLERLLNPSSFLLLVALAFLFPVKNHRQMRWLAKESYGHLVKENWATGIAHGTLPPS